MSNIDQVKFEALKGKELTVKNGRYSYFSWRAGRTLPVKKVIALALVAEGFCSLTAA